MLDQGTLATLAEPWGENEDRTDLGILARLGLDCPSLRLLNVDMRRQLDGRRGGYVWWPDDWLPPDRRRKVGDYILAAAEGVGTNLLEARLHQLAAADAALRNDQRVVLRLQSAGGNLPTVKNKSPLDGLAATEMDLHVAGAMRALGSATDCLAALTIGVAALSTDLVRCSWNSMLRAAEQDEAAIRRSDIEAFVAACGPDDWLTWAVDYRNSIVHRARRLEFAVISGMPPAAECETYLAADPDGTEAEVLATRGVGGRVIRETSRTTVPGVVTSTHALAEELVYRLSEIWRGRASGELEMAQPLSQWPREGYRVTDFLGYAPGRLPDVRMAVMHPDLASRLRAAGA